MTDAPPIQYARTSDGVNIAYWTYGSGPPLVLMPLLIGSHVQMDWTNTSRTAAFERLASGATVIRYDPRSMGMSDREPIDFSPEAGIKDLTAVVDKLGLDRFAILSQQVTGDAGLLFAADNPARVTGVAHRIVLAVSRADTVQQLRLIRPLMDQDWELYTHILGRLMAGWNDPDADRLAQVIYSSHSPTSFKAVSQYLVSRVSSDGMPDIRVPVLLLHSAGDEAESAIARQMASALTDCRVLAIPRIGIGSSAAGLGGPYPNEVGLTAILDFIAAPETARVEARGDAGLRTILFTDLVDHTAMMTRLGDEKGRDVLREHERITREVLKANGGTEVKTMGDGFMASFGSVTKAVECAVALQRAFAAEVEEPSGDVASSAGGTVVPQPLRVRIGLNAGEPIEEEGDLFGSTVIIAARIAAAAGAGEILVSDVIRQLVTGKGFLFNDRGEHALKGFEDPVRIYEVNWNEA